MARWMTAKEVAIAVLLSLYTIIFVVVLYLAWTATEASSLGQLAGTADRVAFLKTVLYVVAAGGLGSTTYCIRAFYAYYIQGEFSFDTYKWWYVFRPLTGMILALAVFALTRGGVVALGATVQDTPGTANLTFFGVSYLAGFGTEQVIEWLRRASKSLFGESKITQDRDVGAG